MGLEIDSITEDAILFRWKGVDCEALIVDGRVQRKSIQACESHFSSLSLPVKQLAKELNRVLDDQDS